MKKFCRMLIFFTLIGLCHTFLTDVLYVDAEEAKNMISSYAASDPEEPSTIVPTKKIVKLKHGESFSITKNYYSYDKFTFKVRSFSRELQRFGVRHGYVLNGKQYYNSEVNSRRKNFEIVEEELGYIVRGKGEHVFTVTNYSNEAAYYQIGVNITPQGISSDFSF